MSAAEPNAADLAAICRRLDRHEPRATDAEGFKNLVEGAAAAGQIRRLARAAARLYAPAGRRIASTCARAESVPPARGPEPITR
jgi:hypothetical protein